MSPKPLISFVVPTKNRIEFMPECLSGLLGQTVQDIEVVIVNDGSNDGTKELLNNYYAKIPKVQVIHNEKSIGAGQSRNKGIEVAKADIIAVCDDDDCYPVTRAERILKFFKDVPSGAMLNAPYMRIDYYNRIVERFEGDHFDHDAFKVDKSINFFCHPAAAYTKKDILEIGGYKSETPDKTDDFQLVDDWITSGKKIGFDKEEFHVLHRVLPDSIMAKMRGFNPAWNRPKNGLVSLA